MAQYNGKGSNGGGVNSLKEFDRQRWLREHGVDSIEVPDNVQQKIDEQHLSPRGKHALRASKRPELAKLFGTAKMAADRYLEVFPQVTDDQLDDGQGGKLNRHDVIVTTVLKTFRDDELHYDGGPNRPIEAGLKAARKALFDSLNTPSGPANKPRVTSQRKPAGNTAVAQAFAKVAAAPKATTPKAETPTDDTVTTPVDQSPVPVKKATAAKKTAAKKAPAKKAAVKATDEAEQSELVAATA